MNSPLTFVIDESLSPLLVQKLRYLGYEAVAVREIGLRGAMDIDIVKWAQQRNAVIITADLDFGELWYWNYSGQLGVIILRLLSSQRLSAQKAAIEYLHQKEVLRYSDINKSLIITTGHRYRIRTLKSL